MIALSQSYDIEPQTNRMCITRKAKHKDDIKNVDNTKIPDWLRKVSGNDHSNQTGEVHRLTGLTFHLTARL